MTTLRKILVLASVLAPQTVLAQEYGPTARLEMWRHERLQKTVDDAKLSPFTTDGCSGGMSAAWKTVASLFPDFEDVHDRTPPWEGCCVTHDQAYHAGGAEPSSEAGFLARLKADEALRVCVAGSVSGKSEELQAEYNLTDQQVIWGFETVADAMFDAVRIGGAPCSGLPWRWGYGRPQCW
ncbi:hypothetical protein [Shimia abyssi]|uniref:Phospholipase A2-like protein n=1 Tax=Shimia abyssi TaxID=1662395 RepID=A0A2P8FC49_9RHOB|nr:hypothetical protein [Shimia abyssi]PSL19307.1 hypothetical protein CLV88_10618 [Shimia abyssi]